ncbi:MAG: hypothetical protein P8J64_07100 [Dehalococcoidia bacterium]|nr:hypothetical protein [Dehalococcoidia bacterium]
MFNLLKNILIWMMVCGLFFGVSAVGGYVYGYSPSIERIDVSLDESARTSTPLTFGGPVLEVKKTNDQETIIKIAKYSTDIESTSSNQNLTPTEFKVNADVLIEKLILLEPENELAILTNGENINLGIGRTEMGLYISGIVVFREEIEQ